MITKEKLPMRTLFLRDHGFAGAQHHPERQPSLARGG
jgi:hypothetical protein